MNIYELAEIPFLDDAGNVHTVKNDAKEIKALSAEKKCSQCNKKFGVMIPSIYVYKFKAKGKLQWFCGWNCMCRYRKGLEEIDARRKTSKI